MVRPGLGWAPGTKLGTGLGTAAGTGSDRTGGCGSPGMRLPLPPRRFRARSALPERCRSWRRRSGVDAAAGKQKIKKKRSPRGRRWGCGRLSSPPRVLPKFLLLAGTALVWRFLDGQSLGAGWSRRNAERCRDRSVNAGSGAGAALGFGALLSGICCLPKHRDGTIPGIPGFGRARDFGGEALPLFMININYGARLSSHG